MDNRYSLSVIIPNYNKEKYLRRCVESIVSQTLNPDEIIVVDDCSTDGSRNVIASLTEQYEMVKPLYLDKNGGVSNARNTGLSLALGEYVTFIDSDDYYYADYKLEREMKLIRKYAEKGQNIVAYSAMVIVDEDDNPLYIPVLKNPWYLNGNVYNRFISRVKTETIPRDYIVKKSLIESVGAYSYPKNLYEDLDLLFRLSKAAEFYCTLGYGTAYVQTAGGLSAAAAEEHTATIADIVDNYYGDFSTAEKVMSVCNKATWKIERIVLRVLRKLYTGI